MANVLRGSKDSLHGRDGLYMVSVGRTRITLVLAQAKAADKSNEISAIPVR